MLADRASLDLEMRVVPDLGLRKNDRNLPNICFWPGFYFFQIFLDKRIQNIAEIVPKEPCNSLVILCEVAVLTHALDD